MKYDPNLNIKFKTICVDSRCDYVFVYWKVIPKELPFVYRLFRNPWRKVLIVRGHDKWYSRMLFWGECNEIVCCTKTVGDIEKYNSTMREKLKENKSAKDL